ALSSRSAGRGARRALAARAVLRAADLPLASLGPPLRQPPGIAPSTDPLPREPPAPLGTRLVNIVQRGDPTRVNGAAQNGDILDLHGDGVAQCHLVAG